MICSSRSVPSVAATSACVSPRVKSAEPWARGSTPVRISIGRTVRVSRPSMRGSPDEDLAAHDLGFDVEQDVVDLDLVDGGAAFGRSAAIVDARRRRGSACVRACFERIWYASRSFCSASASTLAMKRLVLGRRLPVPHRLAGLLDQLVDRGDRDVALLVAEDDAAEHDLFGQLLGFRLDHQHRGLGAGDDEVQLRRRPAAALVGLSTYWPSM